MGVEALKLNRGETLRRAGDFDHHVGTVDQLKQPLGFADRVVGVVGQQRRDFQTDITIIAVRALVHRTQHVRRVLNIGNRQGFVNLP